MRLRPTSLDRPNGPAPQSGTPDLCLRRDVCLIDLYETLFEVDFAGVPARLAERAGVAADAFREAADAVAPNVTTGEITMAEAMRTVLRACGVEAGESLVRDLVDLDRCMLIDAVRLHDDALSFLEMLRARRVRSAFVSNCAENTRPLLVHLGLDSLVDAVVLSCEVGYAKPSEPIYRRALRELGAEPRAAVFVDDQAEYCAGAARLGIAAAQIVRDPGVATPARAGTTVVRSLMEVERLFLEAD